MELSVRWGTPLKVIPGEAWRIRVSGMRETKKRTQAGRSQGTISQGLRKDRISAGGHGQMPEE